MSNRYGPRIVTDGLTLCLDAGDTNSYSGSGSTIYDLCGTYHSTGSNFLFQTIDGVKCFRLNGGGIVDAGTTFQIGSSHTFNGWARIFTNASTANWRTLWRTQPDDHVLLVSYGSGGGSDGDIGYYDNNAGGFVSFGVNVNTLGIEAKWTMYTVVGAAASGSSLYLNGQYISSVNYRCFGNYWDAWGGTSTGGQPFGEFASTQIYQNKALSADEILQNYNATKGRFGL